VKLRRCGGAARGAALVLASAALFPLPLAAEEDFWEVLRLPHFVESDAAWVVRPTGEKATADPLLRVRYLRLRLKPPGFAEPPRASWPGRSLLLLDFGGEVRAVAEAAWLPGAARTDRRSLPVSRSRLSSGRTPLETRRLALEPSEGEGPCSGANLSTTGGGAELRWAAEDATLRSVVAALSDLREAAAGPGESARLLLLRRIEWPKGTAEQLRPLLSLLAGETAPSRSPGRAADGPALVAFPDPGHPSDLAPFRALTWIPTELGPLPPSGQRGGP